MGIDDGNGDARKARLGKVGIQVGVKACLEHICGWRGLDVLGLEGLLVIIVKPAITQDNGTVRLAAIWPLVIRKVVWDAVLPCLRETTWASILIIRDDGAIHRYGFSHISHTMSHERMDVSGKRAAAKDKDAQGQQRHKATDQLAYPIRPRPCARPRIPHRQTAPARSYPRTR